MTPEMEKEIFEFIGAIKSDINNIKEDITPLTTKVDKLEKEFSHLKGKLVVVAGIVTFALNAVWQTLKGAF
jgi:peptidoglycan hydrolase CwlO-like protein